MYTARHSSPTTTLISSSCKPRFRVDGVGCRVLGVWFWVWSISIEWQRWAVTEVECTNQSHAHAAAAGLGLLGKYRETHMLFVPEAYTRSRALNPRLQAPPVSQT